MLNVNYGGTATGPNLNFRALDELDDVFTRRFFFFDSVSGYARLRCVVGFQQGQDHGMMSGGPLDGGIRAGVPLFLSLQPVHHRILLIICLLCQTCTLAVQNDDRKHDNGNKTTAYIRRRSAGN